MMMNDDDDDDDYDDDGDDDDDNDDDDDDDCHHHVGRHSLSLLKILLIGYLIVVFIGQQLLHDSILTCFWTSGSDKYEFHARLAVASDKPRSACCAM